MHAVRNLVRIGVGVVSVRWSQLGFGRTSSTHRPGDPAQPVRLQGRHQQPQGRGRRRARPSSSGSPTATAAPTGWPAAPYLVTRRIRMLIETVGPHLAGRAGARSSAGPRATAPRSASGERVRPESTSPAGRTASPRSRTSHVLLAHPATTATAILRRGYNFVDGSDGLGRLDAGLFFIAYQRDPETGFVQVQRNLRLDELNEYIRHVLRRLRLPARRPGGRRLVGAGASSRAESRPVSRGGPARNGVGAPHPRHVLKGFLTDGSVRSPDPSSMCRTAPKWTTMRGNAGSPRGGDVVARSNRAGQRGVTPPWSNRVDGAWETATNCTS